ncbi:MAG: ABC transporter permease [Phycisphaerae bacterium]|nr:ABC transporter permease [Phycisphaerae bacterium]
MIAYVIRRLIQLPIILWVIYTLTYVLICQHPGNPFIDDKTPREQRALLAARYGVVDTPADAPWRQRWADRGRTYVNYLGRLVLHGDFGLSSQNAGKTVGDIIGSTLPRSMMLGAFALVLAVLVGCSLGVLAAVRSHGPVDYFVMLYAMLGISLPTFVIGAVLLSFFGFTLGLFPVGGWGSPAQLVLPGITLSLPFTAYIARLTRAGMMDVLHADYIRTARAKGLPERRVVLKHAFKLAFLPVLSFLGPATAAILTGSFVVEKIFNIPGIGRAFVISVQSKDYGLILGTVMIYSTLLVVANLIVDLAYGLVDPRIRLEGDA